MRRHPIVPRIWLRDGVQNWKVRIPPDLQSDTEPKTRNFREERLALAFAKNLSNARLSLAAKFLKLPQIEQSKVLRRYEEENAHANITVEQAGKLCLESKRSAGRRENSLCAIGCAFRSMSERFGVKSIQAICADDIDGWLASHAEWSPKTKLNNLKYASSLFAWCERKNLLARNPCKGVERPAVPFKPVQILTVAGIRQILETSRRHDPSLLGFFSLVLFGGLRVAEARRCLASELTGGRVDLGGDKCKLKNRRGFKMTAQLAAWLAAWQADGKLYGSVEVPNFNNRLKSLIKLSGVEVPKNSLRHSMCSYNLQIHGAMITARMANNSETMLNNHYATMVSEEDAQAFAEILP